MREPADDLLKNLPASELDKYVINEEPKHTGDFISFALYIFCLLFRVWQHKLSRDSKL